MEDFQFLSSLLLLFDYDDYDLARRGENERRVAINHHKYYTARGFVVISLEAQIKGRTQSEIMNLRFQFKQKQRNLIIKSAPDVVRIIID